jgi:hypothetical protein
MGMRRPIAAVLAVIVASLVGSSAVVAATSHPLSATIRSNKVETVRGTILEAGVIRGGLGEGATLIRFRQASASSAKITFKVWYEAGTFSGAVTVKLTNRGTRFTGTGRITGGTGRFAGVTGTFTTHANRSASGLWVQQLRGTLVF